VSQKTEIKIADGQDATRRQLLEAAAEVFAEAGFRSATVREICRRAGANIAAINYHFGDKEKLYAEVLHYAHGQALEKYPPLLGVGESAPAEKKLRAFIHSLLLRIFDDHPTACHGKLMSREMIDPTVALDSLVEEFIRPMSAQLYQIVADILGCAPGDERVRLCAFSVVSQCMFYKHCSPVLARMFPDRPPMDAPAVENLAEHIAKFSLTALKSFSEKKKR
jgi:AcrR family transcriptional regulator